MDHLDYPPPCLRIHSKEDWEHFWRKILPNFQRCSALKHLLPDFLAVGILTEEDYESLNSRNVTTCTEQVNKLWGYLKKLPIQDFLTKVLPKLLELSPEIIPPEFRAHCDFHRRIEDTLVTAADGRYIFGNCLRCNLPKGRLRPRQLAEKFYCNGCLTDQQYEIIIDQRTRWEEWRALFKAVQNIPIGFISLHLETEIVGLLLRNHVPVPENIKSILAHGIPHTCCEHYSLQETKHTTGNDGKQSHCFLHAETSDSVCSLPEKEALACPSDFRSSSVRSTGTKAQKDEYNSRGNGITSAKLLCSVEEAGMQDEMSKHDFLQEEQDGVTTIGDSTGRVDQDRAQHRKSGTIKTNQVVEISSEVKCLPSGVIDTKPDDEHDTLLKAIVASAGTDTNQSSELHIHQFLSFRYNCMEAGIHDEHEIITLYKEYAGKSKEMQRKSKSQDTEKGKSSHTDKSDELTTVMDAMFKFTGKTLKVIDDGSKEVTFLKNLDGFARYLYKAVKK